MGDEHSGEWDSLSQVSHALYIALKAHFTSPEQVALAGHCEAAAFALVEDALAGQMQPFERQMIAQDFLEWCNKNAESGATEAAPS